LFWKIVKTEASLKLNGSSCMGFAFYGSISFSLIFENYLLHPSNDSCTSSNFKYFNYVLWMWLAVGLRVFLKKN